jgi:16S rRNA (cytosine1402-N4)-methyltransferase
MDNINNEPPKHKRRVRYKGSNPRQFKDKYKEHAFEKYPEDVEKVIASGKTPAGTHRPICVNEILSLLNPLPGQVGLDATLGFGGHTLEFLKKITPGGRLYALDVDSVEIVRTEKRLRALGYSDKELIIKHSNFAGASKLLQEEPEGFDFILADLGISSMQLDNPERGFTFKYTGPLDLRLNPAKGLSAAQLIRTLNVDQLEALLDENADEPAAKMIASAMFTQQHMIHTTTDLANLIAQTLDKKPLADCSKETTTSIRRVFQALRIAVNNEFSVLDQFLRNLPFCLKPNGKAAILSFHSGEDLRVEESFKQGLTNGLYAEICTKAIRPSAEEQFRNSRSTSALLRWGGKVIFTRAHPLFIYLKRIIPEVNNEFLNRALSSSSPELPLIALQILKSSFVSNNPICELTATSIVPASV